MTGAEQPTRPRELSLLQALRRMMALAKGEWVLLTVGTLCTMVSGGLNLVVPQGIRILIDRVGTDQSFLSHNIILVFVLLVLALAVTTGLFVYIFALAGFRIISELRGHTFGHLLQQEIGFYDQRKTGELMSRLTSDTGALHNMVSVNIPSILRNVLLIIGGIALLIYSSPMLSLIMLLVVPVIGLTAVWFGGKIRHTSKQFQDELAVAGEISEEALAGVRTVRSFAREAHETGRFRAAMDRAVGAIRKRAVFASFFQSTVLLSMYVTMGIVLGYGAQLIGQGVMTVGELASFFIYTVIVGVSFTTLAALWAEFNRAAGSAARVFEIIDRRPKISNTSGDRPRNVTGRLELREVSFSYPTRSDFPAIRNMSFSIQPGEVVALVGPSGSGKSTVANLVQRFYDPGTGEILLDGRPITELDPSWLRGRIGTVSQEPILFSTTIRENIAYSRLEASEREVVQAAKVAHAHEFIRGFPMGYDTEVGERGIKLSGGQKQRVAIARAVLKNPAILILDEATSALDAESEFLVKDALDHLMKGRTTLVIAHRLSTVKDADRVVVLEAGQIVEMGPHRQLLARGEGMYKKLVERQFVDGDHSADNP